MSTPIEPSARVGALDALRGIALLGILIANARQMFLPWELANLPVAVSGGSELVWWEWAVFDGLIDLKFLTVFSLLFGIGFELLQQRLAEQRQPFAWVYIRRLFVLGLLGFAHALLLYPAEVLLPYAIGGLLLLACRRLSTRALISGGLAFLGMAILLAFQFAQFGRPDLVRTAGALAVLIIVMPVVVVRGWRVTAAMWLLAVTLAAAGIQASAVAPSSTTSERREYLAAVDVARGLAGESAAAWPEEASVHRRGDFRSLVGLRGRLYADILLTFAFILLWRTLGLFMIGAALVRMGAFLPEHTRLWRPVMIWGLGVGVPASVVATTLRARTLLGAPGGHFAGLLHHVSALILAAGVVAAVVVAYAETGGRRAWHPFEAAGRMPLSNYLGQSLVMATIAESWGGGWYGYLDTTVLSALATLVFAGLAVFSMSWLRTHKMGPMEWAWRCATYGRLLPNRAVPARARP